MKTTRAAGFLGLLALLVSAVSVPRARAADDKGDAEIRFNAGLAHLREGRAAMALEEFKKAVSQDPKNPYFYKGLGQAYAAERRFKDAVDAFRKSLELNPYFVDVRNDLGTALILEGRREEGIQQFITAYNDPTNPTPELTARNLGQAYFEEKQYEEALNWYRTSLSRNAKYPDAHMGLADTLAAMGNRDAALAELERGVQAVPDYPPLLLALGKAYYRAGRFGEARKQFEACVRLNPAGAVGLEAADLLKKFPH